MQSGWEFKRPKVVRGKFCEKHSESELLRAKGRATTQLWFGKRVNWIFRPTNMAPISCVLFGSTVSTMAENRRERRRNYWESQWEAQFVTGLYWNCKHWIHPFFFHCSRHCPITVASQAYNFGLFPPSPAIRNRNSKLVVKLASADAIRGVYN